MLIKQHAGSALDLLNAFLVLDIPSHVADDLCIHRRHGVIHEASRQLLSSIASDHSPTLRLGTASQQPLTVQLLIREFCLSHIDERCLLVSLIIAHIILVIHQPSPARIKHIRLLVHIRTHVLHVALLC